MKNIVLLPLTLIFICSCSTSGMKLSNSNESIGTNFNADKKQYYYCYSESCQTSTKLIPYSPDDFKPLEPDYVPPVVIIDNQIHHKKRKVIKKRHKRKNAKQTNLITKCFVVNKNESGMVAISGNKLVPVSSRDAQEIQFLESAVKTKAKKK